MIGELLYGLTNRDTGAQFIETYQRSVLVQAAATTVSAFISLPADRALILLTASIQGDAGAAQTCSELYIGALQQQLQPVTYFVRSLPAAAQRNVFNWSGILYLVGGGQLEADAVFNAGVAANSVRLHLIGYTIPRGNVGLG